MVTEETKTEAQQSPQSNSSKSADRLDALFRAGAHYGTSKSKRHPSTQEYVYGAKNNVALFDLEKTISKLEEAKQYVKKLGSEGKILLFVAGKAEARKPIAQAAESLGLPYVAGRFKGGTLTNFEEIRKRVKKLEELTEKREAGEFHKYTKKERLMLDREIAELEESYTGLIPMTRLPDAIYIVDIARESIALKEAQALGIPVITLSSSDCDFSLADHPIPGNDASRQTIHFITDELAQAYKEGRT